MFFFFNDTATTEIYTLSLHDALPISKTARAVELPHRDQVEEVHPGAEVRDRAPHPDARETIDDIGRERGAHSPERTGEPDSSVLARIRRVLLEPDHCAEPGNEHGCRGLDPVALQRLHVP